MRHRPLTPTLSPDDKTVGGEGAKRPDLLQRLATQHAERAQQSLLRRLRTVGDVTGPRIVLDGKALLNFASNDYLGLAQHPALSEALIDGARRWGVGATAAHLLGGHREEHAALEEELAAWTGRDKALLFSTGYMANLGVLGALLRDGDVCVQDKLNHACLIDGARLAGAELRRYLHADVGSARRQLESRSDAAALLATDGVFSMDGDVAPLTELAALCREHGALLHVDDAHGLGVLGARGAGSVSEAGLSQHDVPVLMATLGKALGVAGAFVAGSAALIDGLVQFARTHVYTTALPPALAAATRAAVRIAREDDARRAALRARIAQFRHGAQTRGIALMQSHTAAGGSVPDNAGTATSMSPIQPVLVGDSAAALRIARQLEDAGYYVPAIRPPTVPHGAARLRVTLSAAHDEAMVEGLLDALSRCVCESPFPSTGDVGSEA